ncbi:hypothetical protein HN51_032693 [Arachis hypogaea]
MNIEYLFEEYEKEQHEKSKLLSIIKEETDEIINIFALIGQYVVNYLCKKPCKINEQIGYLWVQEILCGHVEQGLKCTRQMGVGYNVLKYGAIDDTHIPCVVSPSDQPKFIGRKGYPTQNIMAVCDWDMCFIFALPGWEDTVHDARIFDNAITTPTMNFPHPSPGKYYLVDTGYPTPKEYIGPYKFDVIILQILDVLLDLQIIMNLKSTIKRTFGVCKNRFAILRHMSKFKIKTQVQIVCATIAIHNFLKRHSEIDTEFNQYEHANILDGEDNSYVDESSDQTLTISSFVEIDHVRDLIRDQIINHMQ